MSSIKEQIKKILITFYPNDTLFIDTILLPINDSSFLSNLNNWYKENSQVSIEDPFHKLYGISEISKPIIRKNLSSFELKKQNIDLLFTIVKNFLKSGNNNILILKQKLNDIFDLYDLNTIHFISEQIYSTPSSFPINFYAFCITIKIIVECYYSQLKNFSFGLFSDLKFSQNDEIFYSELFCCYLIFIYYLYELNLISKRSISLFLLNNNDLFENYTYHVDEDGYNKVKDIISIEDLSILNLITSFFQSNFEKVNIFILYSIKENEYNYLLNFINYQKLLKTINLNCSNAFINKYNIINDFNKIQTLSIKILNKSSQTLVNLQNLINDNKTSLKHFYIEGDNLKINSLPECFSNLMSFNYISNGNNIISFDLSIFEKLEKLNQLTLKSISPEQLTQLINIFQNSPNKSLFTYFDIELNNINSLNKQSILGLIEPLFTLKSMSQVEYFRIKIDNKTTDKTKYFILNTENGYYYINRALEKFQNCQIFSITNHNENYYPEDNLSQGSGKSKKHPLKINEMEDYTLEDNLNECQVFSNGNDTVIYYNDNIKINGNEKRDFNKRLFSQNSGNIGEPKILHIKDDYYKCLYCISKSQRKLKAKPILMTIFKFLTLPRGRQYIIANYNN